MSSSPSIPDVLSTVQFGSSSQQASQRSVISLLRVKLCGSSHPSPHKTRSDQIWSDDMRWNYLGFQSQPSLLNQGIE